MDDHADAPRPHGDETSTTKPPGCR